MINQCHFGDAREILPALASKGLQAQTCVTSPPYFGLRDYGSPGEIGSEQSLDEYIENLVAVFRGVRECLTDDGTLWLNIGDSYCSDGGRTTPQTIRNQAVSGERVRTPAVSGVKLKDRIGVPWAVAFALRSDGWFLRQEIIWEKPNALPESVTDRPTTSHEQIFLFTQSPRYYFDWEAIAERSKGVIEKSGSVESNTWINRSERRDRGHGKRGFRTGELRRPRSVWRFIVGSKQASSHTAAFPVELPTRCIRAGSRRGDLVLDPFLGSGTTAEAAEREMRDWVGVELNQDFATAQRARCGQRGLRLRDRKGGPNRESQ